MFRLGRLRTTNMSPARVTVSPSALSTTTPRSRIPLMTRLLTLTLNLSVMKKMLLTRATSWMSALVVLSPPAITVSPVIPKVLRTVALSRLERNLNL
ncbi:hypothetical protein CGRA01v4_09889 [Colletotrichum graminicola]|nr:hypothetical protein CGRA01v4_09889 [Colletotrichum graminicola]